MENEKKLKAFVKILPSEDISYFQILGASETQTMKSGMVTLPIGNSVGEHTTSGNEEMLIILKGKGEVVINNDSNYSIEKGQIAYIPPDTIHNVVNKGEESLQYIYIVSKT
jgi:mannose-6-phosphate isomerase-like protein (cupin superfamily)